MNIEGMEIESPLGRKFDWGRWGYWVIKALALVVGFAAVVLAGYGLFLFGRMIGAGLIWLWQHAAEVRRVFYSACWLVIFFYFARAMRGLALWIEAKAGQEKEEV